MGVIVKHFFEDISTQLRSCKRKLIVCCAIAVLGTILGIVLFRISNYNWWYCNRYMFVEKLVYGGFFAIFLAYLLYAAAVSILLCLSLIANWTNFLCYVILLAISVYFGANCCAVFACAGALLGALYLILLIAEQAINMLCCFLASCNCSCKRTFGEAFSDNKNIIILQFLSIFAKLLIIFALLRTITALI